MPNPNERNPWGHAYITCLVLIRWGSHRFEFERGIGRNNIDFDTMGVGNHKTTNRW